MKIGNLTFIKGGQRFAEDSNKNQKANIESKDTVILTTNELSVHIAG